MKMALNDFIRRHGTGIGINLIFRDYYDALQRRKRARRGAAAKFKFKDGQELPTPNEVVREMMKKAKGDYVIESERTIAQKILLADPSDAENILKAFPGQRRQSSSPKPFNSITDSLVSETNHIRLAQQLKLLGPLRK